VIKYFRNVGTHDVAKNIPSKSARQAIPTVLHEKARIKLALLDAATSLEQVARTPGYKLEKLKGDRAGQYSIRINRQFRICFIWTGKNAEAVEITDYH